MSAHSTLVAMCVCASSGPVFVLACIYKLDILPESSLTASLCVKLVVLPIRFVPHLLHNYLLHIKLVVSYACQQ